MVTCLWLAEKESASSSHVGASFLQWPHHGAKNSTRAGLPESTVLLKLSGVRSTTLEAVTMVARARVKKPFTVNILTAWVSVYDGRVVHRKMLCL